MFKKLLCGLVIAITVSSGFSSADDTELYLIENNASTGKSPQILFVFDNSGSMSTEDENAVSSYCYEGNTSESCAAFNTYAEKYAGYINSKGIYWNAGGIDNTSLAPTPNDPTDSRRFYAENNNCFSAVKSLEDKGRYTGLLREYKSKGQTGSWVPLAENEGFNKGQIVDCYQDFVIDPTGNPGTGITGYPIDTGAMYSQTKESESLFSKGAPVTLYTARYLVWYQWVTTTQEGKDSGTTGTRLEVAKSALSDVLIEWNVAKISIDAGLAVFNLNHAAEGNADGGRIVSSIKNMTDANRVSLISLINGMPAQTNTPLCETLYEAYQYFSGGPVTFGNKDANAKGSDNIDDYVPNSPPSILATGNYTSPFKKCADTAYIVYITDGAPTLDHSADSLISDLIPSANPKGNYSEFTFTNDKGELEKSFLPALASYMANNDLVKGVTDANGVDHEQNVRLFTIGFSEGADIAAALLEEAAYRAGSARVKNEDKLISKGYKKANDSLELMEAFNEVLKSIYSVDSSFTSPSIASNNFDKTQTYNSAYFAMFLPGKGPRWSGNLKKLKVNSAGEIVAPGGADNAIDANGNISAKTCTYWNTCFANFEDGNKVNSGGVLPMLRTKLMSREILTNSGGSIINITDSDFVTEHSNNDLAWLYGRDVDDDNNDGAFTDAREDIMGDPLHSKPLAINFGEKPNADGTESLDVRVLVGTNQGLVHMFKDSDSGSTDYKVGSVTETWAFIPQELWGNIPKLRQNDPTGSHSVYGMDLSPVAYTETNVDGKVNKAWVYLGMRSGGTSYYALDITSPDTPKFLWKIDSNLSDFAKLGQTWSEPVVTFIPSQVKPVLIFGGGYPTSNGSGAVVYIVDAETGAYINEFTTGGMDSIPNKVAVLDSNNDGITDRIYATDISGSIWRMDLPTETPNDWSVFKFASISTGTSPNNRMFFVEPTVAQTQFSNIHSEGGVTSYQRVPYDAVTVGTGNRMHPLDTTTNDMFYVFQDRNVISRTFKDVDVPTTLVLDDLYNVTTAAPISDPSNTDYESSNLAFGAKRGWYYDFPSSGEKSLSASLIFNGKVYFTSFVPPISQSIDVDTGVCGYSGQGRLYVFDLHKGTRSYSETYFEIGERVPDTPQIVIPKPDPGKEAEAYVIGVGKGECENGECSGTVKLGSGLSTNKIYYHLDEK